MRPLLNSNMAPKNKEISIDLRGEGTTHKHTPAPSTPTQKSALTPTERSNMSQFSGLKSFVSKFSGKAKSAAESSLVSSSTTKSSSTGSDNVLMQFVAKVNSKLESYEPVKEWKCWCGHVFKAPGEWYPTEPAMCEAPGCPNPKFFLSGPGRAMLAAGGPPAPQVGGAAGAAGQLPEGAKKLPTGGMGGRLK